MNTTRKNKSASGHEIFEQALTLSTQGIDLLLKNFFDQISYVTFHHLSAKDSKRLIAQINRKRDAIYRSFLIQFKKNFADFAALRKSRPPESKASDRHLLGLVGTNEFTESEELGSTIARFEVRYYKFYLSTGKALRHCIRGNQVDPIDNPLHVKHLCRSFQYSIKGLNLVIAQKIALHRLFADSVIDRLEPLYASLEQYFIEHNVPPDCNSMPIKSSTQESSTVPTPGSSVATSHIPALVDVFQNFKEKSNRTEGACRDFFPELKQILGQRDIKDFNHLIDHLATIFEVVFSDEDLADRIKEQIARLQIFIFMSEIRQSGFLIHSSHPARRLIETVIRTEVDFELAGLSDRSGYDFLRKEIDNISNEPFIEAHTYDNLRERYIRYTIDKPTFGTVADIKAGEKSGHLEAEDEAEFNAISEPGFEPDHESEMVEIELVDVEPDIASQKFENNVAVIQSIVDEITMPLRIQGRSLILFDQVWSPLLLEVATAQGFKSPAWQQLITIAKTQAWILTPKNNQDDLDKLMSMFATVERSLIQSMQSLSKSADQQASLLEFLEREQADVIAHTRARIEESLLVAVHLKAKPPTEEPYLARQKPDNDDFSDTINEFSNLMESGRFNRSHGILKALKSEHSASKPKTIVDAKNIHKSDWVKFKRDDNCILAKLTWKAKDNSQFIFVDHDGNRVCEISRAGLDKALTAGNISLISSTSVSSRRPAFNAIQTIK